MGSLWERENPTFGWVGWLVGLVWFGLVWFGLVWFGLVWFGLVWFGLVWFGLVWFGLVWFGWLVGWLVGGSLEKSRKSLRAFSKNFDGHDFGTIAWKQTTWGWTTTLILVRVRAGGFEANIKDTWYPTRFLEAWYSSVDTVDGSEIPNNHLRCRKPC